MASASSYNAGNIYEIYPDGLKRGEKISQKVDEGINKIKDEVSSGFNIINWFRANWKIAVLGLIAIVLLLRRL